VAAYKLALTPGGPKRLEVRPPSLGRKSWDVLLDGTLLGRLETHDEAISGKSFPLPDGTTLTVRLEPVRNLFGSSHRLLVEVDGALLRDSPGHPVQIVKQGAAALWLVGGLLTIAGVVMGVLAARGASFDPGAAIGNAVEGCIYLVFARAASREKRWGLVAGLVLYVIDTIASLAALAAGGWIVRVAVITALVRAIIAHRELQRVDAASIAAVFR